MANAEQTAIIRHANKLVRHEVAKLSPVAQNLMALLFSIWTKEPSEHTALDLTFIRNRLELTHQEDSYLENIILETGREIVNKSFIMARFDGGAVVGSLIYWFQINEQTQKLEVSTTPAFMDLFRRLKDGYAEYDFLTFYKIKSKQGKNIYYLCRKYFKGQFTMDWGDFRRELGYKDTANNKNIMMYVKKAVDYLISHQYLNSCTVTPIYSSGRGRPLTQIHFEYTFPDAERSPETASKSVAPDTLNAESNSISPDSEITPSVNVECAIPKESADQSIQKPALPEMEPFPADNNIVEPIDLTKIHPVVSDDARDAALKSLPTIGEVIGQQLVSVKRSIPDQPVPTPEDELKRLELFCPTCGTKMNIRENSSSHALFWACPKAWNHQCRQKTISLPAEVAEIYWKNKNK